MSATNGDTPEPRRRPRFRPAAGRWAAWDVGLWATLALLAGTFLWRLSSIGTAIQSNADTSSPLTIAHTLEGTPDAAAFLGNYGWWNGLWVVQLLTRLPREIAVATYLPVLLTIAVVVVLALQARALFGGRAALLVPLVAGAVTYATWGLDGAWSGRAASWWAMVGFGVLLVAHARGGFGSRPRTMAAATVVVVLWSAAALSGDALAWVSVVAPGAAVAAVTFLLGRYRAALFPLVATAAIVLASIGVKALADGAGYFKHEDSVEPAMFETAQGGFGALGQSLQVLWGSNAGVPSAAAGYLGGFLLLAAVGGGVVAIFGLLTEPERRKEEDVPGLAAWLTFWAGAAVATCIAYAFSTGVSDPATGPIPRYLYGLPFATAALLAAAAARARRPQAVYVPVALLAVLAAVSMIDRPAPTTPEARLDVLPAVSEIARRYDVTRGYSSYWSASPLTIRSDYFLRIEPVGQCYAPLEQRQLCPASLHYVDRAYEPRRGIRTFLLTDTAPGADVRPSSPYPSTPPAGVKPMLTTVIAPGITMYVYDHDIAADLGDRTTAGEPIAHKD